MRTHERVSESRGLLRLFAENRRIEARRRRYRERARRWSGLALFLAGQETAGAAKSFSGSGVMVRTFTLTNNIDPLCRFLFTFAGDVVNIKSRAGVAARNLAVSVRLLVGGCLHSLPSNPCRRGRAFLPTTYKQLKIERDFCANVRVGFNRCSGETNALAKSQFSRQRASSRSRGGYFPPPPTRVRPGPYLKYSKALGISVTTAGREQLSRFEKGNRVSGGWF